MALSWPQFTKCQTIQQTNSHQSTPCSSGLEVKLLEHLKRRAKPRHVIFFPECIWSIKILANAKAAKGQRKDVLQKVLTFWTFICRGIGFTLQICWPPCRTQSKWSNLVEIRVPEGEVQNLNNLNSNTLKIHWIHLTSCDQKEPPFGTSGKLWMPTFSSGALDCICFLRFCTPTAAFSWGSIQMCPTSLNNKPLVGSFVFVVFCFWHNLPHSTSFHRGWTPRLDGTLMIEHELIATWICCPRPVHSIDGSATMVLWGVAASNEFQVGRRPIFLRSKTLWWLEWSLEFETRSFSKWDRRQRVRCCPIIMTHNISWHLMIFTCNWRSQRLWLLYGELQWIFGFGWGAVLELQLCVEELC